MVKLWVLRGLRKGILTTKYPKAIPTSEEIPSKSIPPSPSTATNWAEGEKVCPTGAIEADEVTGRIDLGKCIYCRKCSAAGFTFENIEGTDLEKPPSTSVALQAGFPAKSIASGKEFLEQFESKWKTFKKSFHIMMLDVGSCNACNLEVLNLSNPYYDLNRLGIFFTNSPKHADALVVVGALNKSMVDVLKKTYEMIPDPKLVISVGACPISGGVFQKTESFVSPVIDAIPVDVEIPGCPPSPIQILQGLLIAMGKLKPANSPSNQNQPQQHEMKEE